ncbi:hypothetical protein [Hymenobacter baengnokdamensis]|uniref:hypothetical protein n=1 Tax=Hymenobacter baengnokdamensis TaxID=2615203 RepID=UPI001246B4E0|nr:hypothetical protein [Hymenobacter baengnokdamensis]
MSTISKKLVGFLYSGEVQALASVSWKTNANAVYGINSAGTGYQVFKPGNTFNSLTQLAPDGVYILDAATTGFELPGAMLTAAAGVGAPTGTITVSSLVPTMTPDGLQLQFGASSTNGGLITLVLDAPIPSHDADVQYGISSFCTPHGPELLYTAITAPGTYYAHFYDAKGVHVVRDFTIQPA